jgi:TPP-dependent pyruvate/acetoin dehydrogenase alpha subunit
LARTAIEHARSGQGPYLIEFKTFRQRGHGEHDDMGYVSKAQREFWEQRDPLRLLTAYLRGEGGFDEAEVGEIDRECAAVVEEAVEYAEGLEAPRPESVTWRLFAE